MPYTRGSVVPLVAEVRNYAEELVDAETITLQVTDPMGTIMVDDVVPVHDSLGMYSYNYVLPADASYGMWEAAWTIHLPTGEAAVGHDSFYVEVSPYFLPGDQAEVVRIRKDLDEQSSLPFEENGTDTFFTNDDILDMLAIEGSHDAAVLKGWERKAARYARLINISESGSERPLRQKFQNAKDMVALWSKKVSEDRSARSKGMRVVARVASLDECPLDDQVSVPSEIYNVSGDNVRYYPLHRSPSILR